MLKKTKKRFHLKAYQIVLLWFLTLFLVVLALVFLYVHRLLVQVESQPATKIMTASNGPTGYDYMVRQTPGGIISTRPVTFVVHVTKDGQPVANHQFKAGISHSYGLFIDPRTSDLTDNTYMSDQNGTFTVVYKSKFWYWQPDSGFGFGAEPVFTAQEQKDYYARISSGEAKGGESIGPTFDLNIYPSFLTHFIPN